MANKFLKTPTEIDAYCKKAVGASLLAIDSETTGLKWMSDKCLGVSLAQGPDEGVFFFLPPVKQRNHLYRLLKSDIPKVLFNAKFDLHFLREAGFEVGGKVYDAYVFAKLWDENRKNHKLKPLAAELVDASAANQSDAIKEWLAQKGLTFGDLASVPRELLAEYGAQDAKITWALFQVLKEKLAADKIPESLQEMESKVQKVAFEMEHKGCVINKTFLERYKKQLQAEQDKLLPQMLKIVPKEFHPDFNPDSDAQVAKILTSLGWKATKKTDDGKDSVDKYVLKDFKHPISDLLLEHRRLGTIRGTFVEGMLSRAVKRPDGWTIHTNYNTAGARTGRWSSSDPNLQNVDKKSEARRGIIPRKGTELWLFDFKQIEPVIFAHHSKSARLIKMFKEGLDYHRFNASLAYGIPYDKVTMDGPERKSAKNLGLAVMYQAGAAKAASMMGVDLARGRSMLATYYKELPEVKELQRATTKAVEDRAQYAAEQAGRLKIHSRYEWEYDGAMLGMRQVPKAGSPGEFWEFVDKDAIEEYGWIKNTFGRKRRLKMSEAYKALNALIQSDAGELLKEAMLRVGRIPLLQVHDELGYELPKAGAKKIALEIKTAMESVAEFFPDVPIRVDVARATKSWAEEEEVKL